MLDLEHRIRCRPLRIYDLSFLVLPRRFLGAHPFEDVSGIESECVSAHVKCLQVADIVTGPRARLCGLCAFDQVWHTGLAIGTDGSPVHPLILRRPRCCPKRAQAIRASQDEIAGEAGPHPDRRRHHLRKVSRIGRLTNQIVYSLQDFGDLSRTLFNPPVRLDF